MVQKGYSLWTFDSMDEAESFLKSIQNDDYNRKFLKNAEIMILTF